MLTIYIQDENMCKSMYREKETNGTRKKEGVYARLKQSGCRKAVIKKYFVSPAGFLFLLIFLIILMIFITQSLK